VGERDIISFFLSLPRSRTLFVAPQVNENGLRTTSFLGGDRRMFSSVETHHLRAPPNRVVRAHRTPGRYSSLPFT
jgi:hypothetical protein